MLDTVPLESAPFPSRERFRRDFWAVPTGRPCVFTDSCRDWPLVADAQGMCGERLSVHDPVLRRVHRVLKDDTVDVATLCYMADEPWACETLIQPQAFGAAD